MPTAGRNQRREQREENVRRWAAYVTTAMAKAGLQPNDVVIASEGAIDKGSLSHWMNVKNPASADGALAFAQALDLDPIEALRAAGHDAHAKAFANAVERAYTRRIAQLDAEREARLARHKAPEEHGSNGAARTPGATG